MGEKTIQESDLRRFLDEARERAGRIALNEMGEIPWTPQELRILEAEGWTYCAACQTMHPPYTPVDSERLAAGLAVAVAALQAIQRNGCGDAAEKCPACMAIDALETLGLR